MHRRHPGITGLRVVATFGKSLAALLAGSAVAAVAGKGTLAIILVVGGVVGAGIGVLADERVKALERSDLQSAASEEQARAAAERERAIASALRVGVCTVRDVIAENLGVDVVDPRILERALKVEDDQLPYVTRGQVDERLRQHLAEARAGRGPALVCLRGSAKAGKSRSMLQAVKAELPDAAIVAPNRTRESLQSVLDCGVLQHAAGETNGFVVLWLDDLEGFVRVGNNGLDSNGLADLKQGLPGLVVGATAGGRGYATQAGLKPSDLFQPLDDLLSHGVVEDLVPSLITAAEREALAAIVPPELVAEMQQGLGAVAVSGRGLVQILVSERNPNFDDGHLCKEGAALTWAAIDAYRLGVAEPISDELLRTLFSCYASTGNEGTFERALRWATTPLYAHVALLRGHGTAYAPYDYLVQHAPSTAVDAARCVWQKLLHTSAPDLLFQLGVSAYLRGMIDDAVDAFRRADEQGDATGAFNLGVLLGDSGDLDGAEAAYRRADERGDEAAASNLGALLKGRGDLEGAEAAYRRAEERAHPGGAFNLAVVLAERGDLEGAEAAYRRADERGHASAASNLGVLLAARGDLDGAEVAYRRAVERGDPAGASNLGMLLEERGDPTGAEVVLRRADERGDATSAFNLGVLLEKLGDLDGAEAAYRRADERGYASGAFNLGVLLEKRGDLDGAEAAHRRADERGHAGGAFDLGVLLADRGDLDGAEAAYRRAVERGDLAGACNLGMLLEERGDPKGAEVVLRRADERGDASSAFNLGVLFEERGDLDGAEAAHRRADERGYASGAFNLGVLLEKRGDLDGAEAAYRRGEERGALAGASNLGVLLKERGDLEGAEAAYRRGEERGDATSAFNLGLLLEERGDLDGAERAYRHAISSPDPDVATRAEAALDDLRP